LKGPGTVSDITVFGRADINAHDIALVHHPWSGDAVDHFVVHRDAGACGKPAVAQEGRFRAGFCDEPVYFPVDLLRGHARGNHFMRNRPCGGCDFSGLAHQFDLPGGFDDYHYQIPSALAMASVVASIVSWFSTVFSLPLAA
jgi:hypothetical protein